MKMMLLALTSFSLGNNLDSNIVGVYITQKGFYTKGSILNVLVCENAPAHFFYFEQKEKA